MADAEVTLKELIEAVGKFEADRDWRQFHSPKNLAMGLAIETGELLEHFQWPDSAESFKVVESPDRMKAVSEELADVFCYLLNLALVLDVDLSDAFFEKMKRNAEKYPIEKYHGRYEL